MSDFKYIVITQTDTGETKDQRVQEFEGNPKGYKDAVAAARFYTKHFFRADVEIVEARCLGRFSRTGQTTHVDTLPGAALSEVAPEVSENGGGE